MKKTTIVVEITTDFKGIEEDGVDLTEDVENAFHNTIGKLIEEKLTRNNELEGEILEQMADDGELPMKIKEISDMGGISIAVRR